MMYSLTVDCAVHVAMVCDSVFRGGMWQLYCDRTGLMCWSSSAYSQVLLPLIPTL